MAEIDYYKTLQDQNYKDLLDREIQLDSARQRALRNTNTNLAAAGMDSSGLGALAQGGIENQYLKGLNEAQNTYQDRALQLQQDQYNDMNAQYTGFTEKLAGWGLDTDEKLNAYLTDRGFMNEDGTFNEEEFSKRYGSHNYNEFLADIQAYRNDNTNDGGENAESVNVNQIIDDVTQKAIQDEYDFLFSGDGLKFLKNVKQGDIVKLSDNKNDKYNGYYKIDENGNWIKATKEEYEKSKGKYWVRSHAGSKDMMVDYNGKTVYDKSTTKMRNAGNILAGILTALSGGLAAPAAFGTAHVSDTASGNRKRREEVDQNYEDYLKALKGND